MKNTHVKAEFVIILDDKLNPEFITERLNLTPTESWMKGDDIEGKIHKRKETCWSVSTEYEESFDINDQLSKLIAVLQDKKDILIELKKQCDMKFIIEIIVRVRKEETPAMYFEREIITFINDLQAVIDIDLYI